MRRSFISFALAAFLSADVASAAEESTAPVTVADPNSSSTTTSSESGVTTSGDSGGSGVRASGALFDKDDTTHRKLMLSFFAEFHWPYYSSVVGPGVGARFAIPIVKGGFVPQINDSFWIEFGLDTGYHFTGFGFSFGLTIPAQAMYMVHLLKNFAVYAKVSFGVQLEFFGYSYCGLGACQPFWAFFHGAGGVGLVYNLSDSFALRAEVLSSGFYAGIAFQF
jgi:hypothetical protein